MSKTTYKSNKTKTIVAVGVFSAFAYVCCVIFHFRASFLSFDLKDSIMAIGAMLFGPACGLAMSIIVALIEFITIGQTGVYGLIMNIISSIVFVCISSFIYSRKRTMTGALIGLICGVAAMTASMLLANLFITPFYMGVSRADVVGLIPTLLFPFNLTKGVFNASLVFLLYKPISGAVRHAGFVSVTIEHRNDGVIGIIKETKKEGKKSSKGIYVATVVLASVIAVASLVYFFVNLGGSFSLK